MRELTCGRGDLRRVAGRFVAAACFLTAILLIAVSAPARAQEGPEAAGLRSLALELVNKSRAEHGLPALTIGREANAAAKAHAADMLRRNYYSHNSPEGKTVGDRFMKAGGSKWLVSAENIARCEGCKPPATPETVEELHVGWMNSPGHRENILLRGLTHFGYSILVDERQGLYAVQVFSGPGAPSGLGPNETAKRLSEPELVREALELFNRERKQARLSPLTSSPALTKAAKSLIPERKIGDFELGQADRILDMLSDDDRADWQSLTVLAGACGGCGAEPTAADIRNFASKWLGESRNKSLVLNPAVTHLGFALTANGQGKKVSLAVLGKAREN